MWSALGTSGSPDPTSWGGNVASAGGGTYFNAASQAQFDSAVTSHRRQLHLPLRRTPGAPSPATPRSVLRVATARVRPPLPIPAGAGYAHTLMPTTAPAPEAQGTLAPRCFAASTKARRRTRGSRARPPSRSARTMTPRAVPARQRSHRPALRSDASGAGGQLPHLVLRRLAAREDRPRPGSRTSSSTWMFKRDREPRGGGASIARLEEAGAESKRGHLGRLDFLSRRASRRTASPSSSRWRPERMSKLVLREKAGHQRKKRWSPTSGATAWTTTSRGR